MSTIVENTNPVTVDIEPKYSVATQSGAIVENKAPEYSVSVQRKEYKVVGDNIYIPRLYDDAPQWMKDLVNTVVDVKTAVAVGNLDDALEALRTLSDELEVAKNTYTNSIISSNDIDQRINTAIETLNSALSDADATIMNIAQTATTPAEASAIALNTLSASLSASGEIGSFISNMNSAFADLDSTTTQSINLMESAIEAEFSANATALNTIRTYVGIDGDGDTTGTGLLANVEILQKQNDGIIETVSGEWDVMLNAQDPDMAQLVIGAEPYASWKALDTTSGIDTRLAHIGDVYIKYSTTANGAKEYIASYKFIRTVVDTTSPYATDSDGFTWALIVDQAAQDAYQQALNAYDLADNKRRVFTTTPTGSIDEGDLWVTGTNPQVVKVYKSGNWELSDTQVGNFISVTYTPTITSLQNQIDGKIESWYTVSTSDPKSAWTDASTRAKHDGDMWYQTDTKLSYYYSSSTNSWNLIDDAKAIQALAEAATAQATADGKISSYYMSTLAAANVMSNTWTDTEKVNNVGDLVVVWNDTTLDNNGTWRWDGTNWVTTRDKKLIALASDVTNLSTELDNGANTWASADSTLENSLRTEIGDEGARVESKFAYNSNVNINGVWKKSGFGLSTNYTSGSGTKANPYVSEFWINAAKLKFTNDNVTGQVAPFTIDATGLTPNITFNGKVSFSNVSDTQGSGTNLLYNSAPKIGNETKGWSIGWSNHGLSSSIGAGWDPWRPTGGASVYVVVPGHPGIGTLFDINNSRFPVIANTRYEASAYLSSHRCKSYVALLWFDNNGNYITESHGTSNSDASGGSLAGWSRSTMFVTAPSNAATAQFYVRSVVTSNDPYCFVAYAYAGIASTNQTIPSNWSEGSSAGVSSGDVVNDINAGNTTTINGSKITTGSITAAQINTAGLIAENISADEIISKTFTGGIINGARINGAVIKASYLDLDGELEVLTNYHITVAMYNANPSLYTDAVYISADNEYRIPSMSTVRENYSTIDISAGGSIFNSKIRSYNCANAGHNNKCVKIQPSIAVSVDVDFFDFNFYNEIPRSFIGITNTYKLYIANVLVCSIYYRRDNVGGNTGFHINGIKANSTNDIIFNTAGQSIKLSFYDFSTYINDSSVVSVYNYGIKATILSGVRPLSLKYDDISKGLIYIENIGGNTIQNINSYLRVIGKTNTYISINNMI